MIIRMSLGAMEIAQHLPDMGAISRTRLPVLVIRASPTFTSDAVGKALDKKDLDATSSKHLHVVMHAWC